MEQYYIGIDIGGTTVKHGLFHGEDLLEKWEIPTRVQEQTIMADIAASIQEKLDARGLAAEQITGAGIAVPGSTDLKQHVYSAVNIGWKDLDLQAEMDKALHIPVVCGNDANIAALAEYWKGCARDVKSFVMLTLGTGLGGGIVIDGHIVNGKHGIGGEVGHIHVNDAEEKACGCGGHGCLEQYASATGAVNNARALLAASDAPSTLREMELNPRNVADQAKAGDRIAAQALSVMAEYLGRGMANIGNILDPDAFVIGGGFARTGDYLLDQVKKVYAKYAFLGFTVDVRYAELGNDAGIYGAAKLAIDTFC